MTLAIDNLDENNIREVIAFLRKFRKKEKVKATILLFKDQTFSSRLKESGFDKNSDIESILHKFFFEDKEFYLKILDLIFSVLNEQKTEVSEKVNVTLPEKEEEMKKFLNENLDQIILGLELEYKKIFTDNFFKEEQRFFITKLLYNNQYSFELSKLIADIFLDKDDEIYEKLTNLLKTDKISKPLLEASFNGLEQ